MHSVVFLYMKRPLLLIAVLTLTACMQDLSPDNGSSSSSSDASTASSVATDLPAAINETDLPLVIPDGFKIETFADGLSGARDIAQDSFGNFWVSRTSPGIVTYLEMSGSTVRTKGDIFRGMRKPHGLAFDSGSGDLYIAEETGIKRARLYSDAPVETITQLPAGGRHFTRSIGFGPDDRLYISIGSTCDVCVEQNALHGSIISVNKNGDDQKTVATGLRNSVFFTWSYVDGRMWATDMGRDQLGDTLPPEEVNIIDTAAATTPHYGWPFCYGDKQRDSSFQAETTFDCAKTVAPKVKLPAHIAPMDLAFIPEEGWPEDYWYDLLVAEHGSWNSSTPVGYKIVRIPLDANGNQNGEPVDFVTGFIDNGNVAGRPVGLLVQPGGTLYITDDKAGAVYRMTLQQEVM